MTLNQQFPPECRLKNGSRFREIYKAGQRAGDEHLLIFALANGDLHTRIGLSVSKKHGSAPQRNRKKRLMREAFRLIRRKLPIGLDCVLVPRQCDDSTLADFQRSLSRLSEKLKRKLQRQPGSQVMEDSPTRADKLARTYPPAEPNKPADGPEVQPGNAARESPNA